jgi:hypothetical protein
MRVHRVLRTGHPGQEDARPWREDLRARLAQGREAASWRLPTAEFESSDGGGLKVFDNQQFYFSPVKGGKLSFHFIADWKANGELAPGAEGTATGFINQKTHITELSCAILTK